MARFFSNIFSSLNRANVFSPRIKNVFVVLVFCVFMAPNVLMLKQTHENIRVSSRVFSKKIKAVRSFRQKGSVGPETGKKIMGSVDMDLAMAQFSALAGQKGVTLVSIKSLENEGRKRGQAFRRRKAELRLKAKEENILAFFKSIEDLPFFCRVTEMSLTCADETGLDARLGLEVNDGFRFNGEEAVDYLQKKPLANPAQAFGAFHPLFLVAPSVKKQVVAVAGSMQDVAGQLMLVGLIEEEGKSKAVFEDKKTGRTIYAFGNDMIGDLTVTEVNASGAVLSGGGQCYAFSL